MAFWPLDFVLCPLRARYGLFLTERSSREGIGDSCGWISDITQLSGTYNMTGKSPVEIKIYGNSRPHWKEYPMYENAEGYQIHPDKTFDHRNGVWNYYWKVK